MVLQKSLEKLNIYSQTSRIGSRETARGSILLFTKYIMLEALI